MGRDAGVAGATLGGGRCRRGRDGAAHRHPDRRHPQPGLRPARAGDVVVVPGPRGHCGPRRLGDRHVRPRPSRATRPRPYDSHRRAWRQWQAESPTLSRIGTLRSRAAAKASSPRRTSRPGCPGAGGGTWRSRSRGGSGGGPCTSTSGSGPFTRAVGAVTPRCRRGDGATKATKAITMAHIMTQSGTIQS